MAFPAFRDLDKLHEWFVKLDAPFWTLYSGKEPERSKRIAVNNGVKNPEESFRWLQETIEAMSEAGGAFHIHAKNSPREDSDTKNVTERAAARLTTSGFHAIFESSTAIAGIGRISGMSQIGDIDRMVEEKVNQRMELIEKEMEIAALSEENQQLKKGKGIMGMTPSEFIPFAVNVVSQIAGLFNKSGTLPSSPVTPQLKVSGLSSEAAEEFQENHQSDKTEPMEFTEQEQERIDNAISRLSEHFTNIVEVVERLADYTDNNPEMAKMFLKNLK